MKMNLDLRNRRNLTIFVSILALGVLIIFTSIIFGGKNEISSQKSNTPFSTDTVTDNEVITIDDQAKNFTSDNYIIIPTDNIQINITPTNIIKVTNTPTPKPDVWISPVSAEASSYDVWAKQNHTGPASFAIDGNRQTEWTVNGLGSIKFDLGEKKTIKRISIWGAGSVTSGNNVKIYIDSELVLDRYVGGIESLEVNKVKGRYITYELLETKNNIWGGIAEIQVLIDTNSY